MAGLPSLPDVSTWAEVVDVLRDLADDTAATREMLEDRPQYSAGHAYLAEVERGLRCAAASIDRHQSAASIPLIAGPEPSRSQAVTRARADGVKTWLAIVAELDRKVTHHAS